MELTEEALQQSAASSGRDRAGNGSRVAGQDLRGDSGAVSGQDHDNARRTPNDDVVMMDQVGGIYQDSGGATGKTTDADDMAYEDGEEDAEGEVDEDYEFMDAQVPYPAEQPIEGDADAPLENMEEGEEEDEEGVGAVKLRPGETDEEDNESEASAASASEGESEGDAEWEEDDEVAENDDEESDNAQSNNCMFCKEDEENDPSEEFEAYLTCAGCGENCKWCSLGNNREGYVLMMMYSSSTMRSRGKGHAIGDL